MSDHEEFGDELKKEWFAGRAQQIHAELKTDFDRYVLELRRRPGAAQTTSSEAFSGGRPAALEPCLVRLAH